MRRAVLLLGGLREKDKLKDSGLKMELFHLEAGILHLRGRKIIRIRLFAALVTSDKHTWIGFTCYVAHRN